MQGALSMQAQRTTLQKRSITRDLFFQTVLFSLLAVSSIRDNSSLLLVSVAAFSVYSIFAQAENVFSLLLGLSIYDYSFHINGANATIIITGILLMKLLGRNRYVIVRQRRDLLYILFILFAEVAGDIFYPSIGEVALSTANILLFLYVITNVEILKMDVLKAILLFTIAYFSAILCMISTYGGIQNYFQLLFTSVGLYRFGIGAANVQGGAMSIPLYALLLLSMTLSYLLSAQSKSFWEKVLLISINAVSVFYAILTISRSFYLGLAAIFLGLLLSSRKEKHFATWKLLGVALFVVVFALVFYGDVIEKAFGLLVNRISVDRDGAGRLQVWRACFDYLITHPLSVFIGCGACTYPTLAVGMKAGAHNLLLDIILSWGLGGAFAILALLGKALGHIKRISDSKSRVFYLPLFAVAAFSLTALRANSLKTWSFLLMAVFVIQSLSSEEKS